VLFGLLESLFPVRFESRSNNDYDSLAGVVLMHGDRDAANQVSDLGLPVFVVLHDEGTRIPSEGAKVTLTHNSVLPRPMRGQTLEVRESLDVAIVAARTDEVVVAAMQGEPIWVLGWRGGAARHFVGTPLPALAGKDFLYEHVNDKQFICFLPLIQFLRDLTAADAWTPPPIRASFIFDDPNLHWKRYGHVDYREMARHAEKHNYHAAFATVPLDAWFVHRDTADLFRENKGRLSLLVHGNNHVRSELGRSFSEEDALALAAQALRRIAWLERRSGVEVSYVMAPPHGPCSEAMMRGMVRVGFEAACISQGWLRELRRESDCRNRIGLAMSENVAGLHLIPRFGMSSRNFRTRILLAAYLDQPVIPAGHHEDAANGLELLEQLASFLNTLGDVHWMDMKSIVRSNFSMRREKEVLYVKMFSRIIRLKVPEEVKQLCIERPWLNAGAAERLRWREDQTDFKVIDSYREEPIAIKSGAELEITSVCSGLIHPDNVPGLSPPLWAIARRQFCEVRDRLSPAVGRLLGSSMAKAKPDRLALSELRQRQ